MRDLHLTSPLMHGPDVKAFQAAINHVLGDPLYTPVVVDGQYGPATKFANGRAAFKLGLDHGDGRISVQQRIEDPSKRSAEQIARAKHRAEQAAKHGQGVIGLIKHAASFIGVAEHPPGSNGGEPEPAGWIRNLGFTPGTSASNKGPSWCGIFVGNMILLAGGHVDHARVAYTPDIETDGKVGANGFVSFTSSLSDARPGDIVTYDWTGRKVFPEHTGIVESVHVSAGTITAIEGNTGGSNPSDGGMVDRVTRPFSEIVGFSRPKF